MQRNSTLMSLQSMGLGDDFLSGLFDSSTFASMAGARKVKGSSILSLGQVVSMDLNDLMLNDALEETGLADVLLRTSSISLGQQDETSCNQAQAAGKPQHASRKQRALGLGLQAMQAAGDITHTEAGGLELPGGLVHVHPVWPVDMNNTNRSCLSPHAALPHLPLPGAMHAAGTMQMKDDLHGARSDPILDAMRMPPPCTTQGGHAHAHSRAAAAGRLHSAMLDLAIIDARGFRLVSVEDEEVERADHISRMESMQQAMQAACMAHGDGDAHAWPPFGGQSLGRTAAGMPGDATCLQAMGPCVAGMDAWTDAMHGPAAGACSSPAGLAGGIANIMQPHPMQLPHAGGQDAYSCYSPGGSNYCHPQLLQPGMHFPVAGTAPAAGMAPAAAGVPASLAALPDMHAGMAVYAAGPAAPYCMTALPATPMQAHAAASGSTFSSVITMHAALPPKSEMAADDTAHLSEMGSFLSAADVHVRALLKALGFTPGQVHTAVNGGSGSLSPLDHWVVAAALRARATYAALYARALAHGTPGCTLGEAYTSGMAEAEAAESSTRMHASSLEHHASSTTGEDGRAHNDVGPSATHPDSAATDGCTAAYYGSEANGPGAVEDGEVEAVEAVALLELKGPLLSQLQAQLQASACLLWAGRQLHNPRPDKVAKDALSAYTGRSIKQISDFFTNWRARHWKPALMAIGLEGVETQGAEDVTEEDGEAGDEEQGVDVNAVAKMVVAAAGAGAAAGPAGTQGSCRVKGKEAEGADGDGDGEGSGRVKGKPRARKACN